MAPRQAGREGVQPRLKFLPAVERGWEGADSKRVAVILVEVPSAAGGHRPVMVAHGGEVGLLAESVHPSSD